MKLDVLTAEEAMVRGQDYPYALLYRLSSVTLGRTKPVNSEELTEARFFGPTGEIHVFQGADGLTARVLAEDGADPVLDKTYDLLPAFGKTLTLRQILDFDSDGQAYVAHTRLLDWKGAEIDAV
ncbi:MAG: hypothetical protein RRY64_00340 [Oscillospiraceae bacterium]